MTDAEKLAEGLLIFLKRPGPTPDDFSRWETILGAHHMHIRVLVDLARKILHERNTTPETTTSEPDRPGEVPPNGALVEGLSPTWEASRKILHDNSPTEGTLRPLESDSIVDGGYGRGRYDGAFGYGTET